MQSLTLLVLQQKKQKEKLRLDRIQIVELFAGRRSVFMSEENESVTNVLLVFRDLCTVIWLLGIRDSLSLALRAVGSKQQVRQLSFIDKRDAVQNI